MTTEDSSFALALHPKWELEATGANYGTLHEKLVALLEKAPNVDDFLPITDIWRSSVKGYLIILKDGKRITVLATLRDSIYFDGAGNVLPEDHDFINEDFYRVIYNHTFDGETVELPYGELPTATEAYNHWLKATKGDSSTYVRTEKRTSTFSEWHEVKGV